MTICDTIADAHYGRRADMAMAFAALLNEEARELEALGVDVIQFDEPAFNVFMDDVKEWGIAALDRAVEGLSCKTAVHICYGYGIKANIDWKSRRSAREWRQYEEIFPALNASRIDQVSLECANSHVPLSLIGLLKDKEVLVGAIDVATHEIETPEQVAAVIRQAAGVRRRRAPPALHELRPGAAAARGRGRQAPGARRGRRSGPPGARRLISSGVRHACRLMLPVDPPGAAIDVRAGKQTQEAPMTSGSSRMAAMGLASLAVALTMAAAPAGADQRVMMGPGPASWQDDLAPITACRLELRAGRASARARGLRRHARGDPGARGA